MRLTDSSFGFVPLRLVCVLTAALTACGGTDTTGLSTPPETLQLTSGQVAALDSSGQAMVQANPGNADLKALVDSTLLVLTAGVQARRLDVSTNLTTKPLYFVGIHRAATSATSSYSTWTLVGIDDPSKLTSLVEVAGFAQTATDSAPASVSGTIGDGAGIVNGLLLAVGNGGAVTEWRAATGDASFSSSAPGAPCPGFTPVGNITCTLETMRVHFTMSAPTGTNGASGRQAAAATDVDVPAMRLTYTF